CGTRVNCRYWKAPPTPTLSWSCSTNQRTDDPRRWSAPPASRCRTGDSGCTDLKDSQHRPVRH
ncbi:MAG: hypothetical protein AVDCRST_MAG75-2224, partial [uncultured Propionibacteriaceae bacterium]